MRILETASVEWEVIDSVGFSVRPPFFDTANEQPYTSFEGPLVPFKNTRATNKTIIIRVQYYRNGVIEMILMATNCIIILE